MAETPKDSWWQTLPGILTAIAAFLTAITGLVVALVQIGVFGTHDNPSAPKSGPALAESQSVPFPPYEEKAVNVWIVGSPHTGAVPSAQLPSEIADNARSALVSVNIKTFSAKNFAATLFAAFDRHSEPDILVIDNYGIIDGITTPLGSFVGIASKAKVNDALIRVSES